MHRTTVRVRYAETDAMGVVYNANYLVWFEVGRGELLRHWEMPYKQFEEAGVMVPLVEAHARYRHPARYDDLVAVETAVEEFTATRIKFTYRIVRLPDEKLLCEGYTTHAFVGPNGRPISLEKQSPTLWHAMLAKMDTQEG